MPNDLKPNRKYQHIYAIIRYETNIDPGTPIDFQVTVKKVVIDPHFAEMEVKRLNDLNREKGAYYFCQVTRFEDAPVQSESVLPLQWTLSEGPRD